MSILDQAGAPFNPITPPGISGDGKQVGAVYMPEVEQLQEHILIAEGAEEFMHEVDCGDRCGSGIAMLAPEMVFSVCRL